MFSLSSKHAVKALLSLAEQDCDKFVSVEELSKISDVPAPYLSKLMKVLARDGLIEAKKGVGGGLRLCKKSISFYEVCDSLDDPAVRASCFLSKQECSSTTPCSYHAHWLKEKKRIAQFLKSMKIERKG